jgi:heavy metal sensor kinase
MSPMRWNSVRFRLTLWNVAVLALILGASGMALCYRVQAEMEASLDRQLKRNDAHIPREGPSPMWDHFPFPPGGYDRHEHGGRFGPDRGPGFAAPYSDGPFRGARGAPAPDARRRRGPGGPGPRPFDPFADFDEETRRRLAFGMPRPLTPEGKPWPGFSQPPYDTATVAPTAAGREQFSTVEIAGVPLRVRSAPVLEDGRVAAVVQFATPLTEQQRLIDGQVRTLITLLPFALLIAGVGGIFLTDRALRPVRRITQAAAQIGVEDLSHRLEVTGQDEFAELASTFNGMIARLEEAFRRLERAFEQQKRFTADASHELRTPLTRVKASVSLALAEQRDAGAYRKALQVVDTAANVMSRLIQDLLLLARADAAQLRLDLRPLSVAELFEDAVAEVPTAAGCPIDIQLPDEPLDVLGDAHSLARLLGNLIGNALRHTPRDGKITLSARREAGSVVLCVEDTGEGIAPEHLPHVADRFYRVDDARTRSTGGTGLGLAICRSIAEAHGGTLTIESVLGQGTIVCAILAHAGGAVVAQEVGIAGVRSY